MQTVYVHKMASDGLPPVGVKVIATYNKVEQEFGDYWTVKCLLENGWTDVGYFEPTEAVLLSKEDADRVVRYQSDKDNEPFGELEKYLVYRKSQARVEICWCPDEKNGKWLAAESYSDTDHYIDNEDIILWASIPMPSPPKPKAK